MIRTAILLCFVATLTSVADVAAAVAVVVDPHHGEGRCNSCHINLPVAGTDGKMDYNFLAEEIDPTCLICHDQECCTIAKPHERTHASGIDRWDREKYGYPATLPLANGYITCVTCHFWRRANNPKSRDYKLVRIVEISSRGIVWTGLCEDCHKGY